MRVVNGVLTEVSNWDIGDGVFLVPEGIKKIGERAFCGCSSLQSITIPKGVKEISRSAFRDCRSLQSITLLEGVETIDNDAFRGCTSLRSIALPDGVQTIGEHAFYYCSSLQNIALPESLETISEWTFSGCTSLQSITLPGGIKKIGSWAFINCTSLQSIALPESIEAINVLVFTGSVALRSIHIFSTSIEERQRITNLLPDELRSRVVAYAFTHRIMDIRNKELGRILQTATTNPMRRCAKNIPFFPDELFTEINKQTNPKDHPFYQNALREISKLALPDSEEALAIYAKEVKRLVDNTIAKSNKVVSQVSRQTRLYDIVKELIWNIENRHNGRMTSGRGSIKVDKLNELKKAVLAYPAYKWLEGESDFIEQIRTVCAMRNKNMHFWKTPESVGEFDVLLQDKGFVPNAATTAPILK